MAKSTTDHSQSGLAGALVKRGLLDRASADLAMERSATERVPFVSAVLESKFVEPSLLARTAADEFGLPLVNLDAVQPERAALALVPMELLQSNNALPLYRRGNRLFVALSDPTNLRALDEIKFHAGLSAEAVLVEHHKLAREITRLVDGHPVADDGGHEHNKDEAADGERDVYSAESVEAPGSSGAREARAEAAADAQPAADGVRLQLDHPTTSSVDDLLGRQPLAQSIAYRLRRIEEELRTNALDEAFIVNVHAPWGAGKSSFLNLLETELNRPTPGADSGWVVVKFNAWAHKSSGAPWWLLIDRIYLDASAALGRDGSALGLRWRERWRRFKAGRGLYYGAAIAAFWVFVLLSLWATGLLAGGLDQLGNSLRALGLVFAASVTIWGVSRGVTETLLPGSVEAAKRFEERIRDPQERLKKHFRELIGDIGRPVAVFVDDLDRCDTDSVVELFEGIQTLFRGGGVIYVVAADRRWLQIAFEARYPEFSEIVREPGRRLGGLFLEKAIQLALPLPGITATTKDAYLKHLLARTHAATAATGDGTGGETITEQEIEAIKDQVSGLKSMTDVEEILAQPVSDQRGQILRQEVVRHISNEAFDVETEHFLSRFVPLLDSNPRALKQFVNAYAVHQSLSILADLPINPEQRGKLALFTILVLRWPLLEEYLAENPTSIKEFTSADPVLVDVPEELRSVFKSGAVADVLQQPPGLRPADIVRFSPLLNSAYASVSRD